MLDLRARQFCRLSSFILMSGRRGNEVNLGRWENAFAYSNLEIDG